MKRKCASLIPKTPSKKARLASEPSPATQRCLDTMGLAIQQAVHEQTANLEQQVIRLNADKSILQQAVTSKDSLIEKWTRASRTATNKLNDGEKRLQAMEAALARADEQFLDQSVYVVELENKVKHLEQEQKTPTATTNDHTGCECDELQNEVRRLNEELVVVRNQLKKKRTQCKALKAHLLSQEEAQYNEADADESDGSADEVSDAEDLGDKDRNMEASSDDSAEDSDFDPERNITKPAELAHEDDEDLFAGEPQHDAEDGDSMEIADGSDAEHDDAKEDP